jgi:uncharacterized membrane protein
MADRLGQEPKAYTVSPVMAELMARAAAAGEATGILREFTRDELLALAATCLATVAAMDQRRIVIDHDPLAAVFWDGEGSSP